MASLRGWIEKIFSTSRYAGVVDQDRARMAYGMNILLLVLFAVTATFAQGANGSSFWQTLLTTPNLLFVFVSFYVLSLISLILVRFGRMGAGSYALVVMWAMSIGFGVSQGGAYGTTGALFLVPLILLGGLLLGRNGLIFGVVLALGLMGFALIRRAVVPPPQTINAANDMVFSGAVFILLAGITYLFLRYARLSRYEGAYQATQERQAVGEISTHIARRVTQRVALSDLLDEVVDRICASVSAIYHAQVFLIDEVGSTARLVAGTGEIGKVLIAREHGLEVGSLSVIGQATLQGKPIIARAGSGESIHRRNEFLPYTVIEVAFPLRIGDAIIGALDLQSKQPDTFHPRLMDALTTLADSLALAIDNVRQYERAEARIRDNQLLVEQTRNALREVERLNERLIGRAWSEYLRGRSDRLGLNIDFEQKSITQDAAWTPTMAEASKSGYLVKEQHPDRQVIAVPLHVRGQVVGALEFELDDARQFTPDDLNLLREVTERFGLAAENTRLVEESQLIAQREALVNEIGSRLQAANNVESTMTEAVRGLRDAVKASRIAIRLGTPPVTQPTRLKG
jgi:GAF domain-containing protein